MTKAELKQSERNILGQLRRRGYSICGRHIGQSPAVGERLIARGLAVGRWCGEVLYLNLTPAGRALIAKEAEHGGEDAR
jgi:hypothetical protein